MSAAGKHSQPYPWEQVEFGHKIYRRTKSEMSSSKLPGVEYEDINSGQGTLNKDITKKSIRKRGIFFQPFDVLFGKLRPYLKNWLYPNFKGVAVGDFWVLYSKLLEPSFIYGMIQTQKFQNVANLSSGSKMPRSDWKLVSGTLFRFPMNENEQRKIGLLLLNLDKTITLHEEKQCQLEQLKKALLQKMFADETGYPVLRFKGFTEKWEQRKLGEIGSFRSGVGFPESEQGGTAGIPFYKVSDMNLSENNTVMNISSNYVTDDQISRNKWKPIDGNTIIFAKVGAAVFLERKRQTRCKFLIDNNMMSYKPNSIQDHDYIYYTFQNLNLSHYAQIGSLPSLNAGELKNVNIVLPDQNERSKVSQLFLNLDRTITLHDKKIQYLKQLKRGLLQKMFV